MEAPRFEKLWQKYEKQGFQVLGIAMSPKGDKLATARGYVKKNGLTFPILVDAPERLRRSYGAPGVPRKVVLAPGGILTFNQTSEKKSKPLEAAVEGAMEAKAAADRHRTPVRFPGWSM